MCQISLRIDWSIKHNGDSRNNPIFIQPIDFWQQHQKFNKGKPSTSGAGRIICWWKKKWGLALSYHIQKWLVKVKSIKFHKRHFPQCWNNVILERTLQETNTKFKTSNQISLKLNTFLKKLNTFLSQVFINRSLNRETDIF